MAVDSYANGNITLFPLWQIWVFSPELSDDLNLGRAVDRLVLHQNHLLHVLLDLLQSRAWAEQVDESCQYDSHLSLLDDSELRIVQPPWPQTVRTRILDYFHNVNSTGAERGAYSQPNIQRLRDRFILSILLL